MSPADGTLTVWNTASAAQDTPPTTWTAGNRGVRNGAGFVARRRARKLVQCTSAKHTRKIRLAAAPAAVVSGTMRRMTASASA